MEGMIGEIRLFAGNFAPKNWSFCLGQTIQISQNTALFSILGTTYGGNGTTNFLLPNLASRTAIGAGSGPGLSTYQLGEAGGVESVTITLATMPAHTHVGTGNYSPTAYNGIGDESNPGGGYFATGGGGVGDNYNSSPDTQLGASVLTGTATPVGGNSPHENQQPFLGMNYVICMYGVYPSRN